MNSNGMLPDYQNAYRKFHSIDTTVLKLVIDLLTAIDQKYSAAVVAIDLSAAFDTVDHGILISILHDKCGLGNTALD